MRVRSKSDSEITCVDDSAEVELGQWFSGSLGLGHILSKWAWVTGSEKFGRVTLSLSEAPSQLRVEAIRSGTEFSTCLNFVARL